MTAQRRFRIRGVVQGVGFRPFVYRIATGLGLTGTVWNDVDGVVICVRGEEQQLVQFCAQLEMETPPAAWIAEVSDESHLAFVDSVPFAIRESEIATHAPTVPISPDLAPCEECLRELRDPRDRRYRYPFLNCTNCGPRFTIIESVPYDRQRTTMAKFRMCAQCEDEYNDPSNRRFHAQPTACADCGPRLTLFPHEPGDPITNAAKLLRDGKILAIKGIGGFHLACDATNEDAVDRLRDRKHRDDKPFAVMMRDVQQAKRFVALSEQDARSLASHVRPIVLTRALADSEIAPGVAEGLIEIGIMLPSSPLHVLLAEEIDTPLIMTSGNASDEPIAYENEDAQRRLSRIADGFLLHDRPIHMRCDDSIVRGKQVLRRARGFVPRAVIAPYATSAAILATGADLKNTISLTRDNQILTSHHIGDLSHVSAAHSFETAIEHFCDLFDVRPTVVAHDLHPEYHSSKFAVELDVLHTPVQHHHAHVASCMIDNDVNEKILALAFDGHGWGPDGTIWGGELLKADFFGYERLAHIPYVGLPGGDKAAREPWRMAVAWVGQVVGEDAVKYFAREYDFDMRWPEILTLANAPRTMRTSSAGRLFDAAAFFVTRRHSTTYEGQAAMELEALAYLSKGRFTFDIPSTAANELTLRALFNGILGACVAGEAPEDIAFAIHEAVARYAVHVCAQFGEQHGISKVALTGGVFQNALLTELCVQQLAQHGMTPLTHRDIPPNDGGISIGQAAIALAQRSRAQ